MSSLMESIGSSITPDLTSGLAERFGIPADSADSALKTSAATMFTTLAARAHEQDFVDRIYHLISTSTSMAAASGVGGYGSPAATTKASDFLSELFGAQLSNVQAKIAEASSIPSQAAGGIMMAAAPMVMSALAEKAQTGALSAASFGTMLTAELPGLRGFLPAGFAIPGLAEFPAATASARATTAEALADETSGPAGWLWPLLIFGALLIAGLTWYFSRTNDEAKVNDTAATQTTSAPNAESAVADGASSAAAALGSFFKRKLPDGTELNIPENGIENKLVAFIEDPSRTVEPPTWFDFDRLLFATGSATLEPLSNEQLINVADIMKAYPKVSIRIGGYTDNTGDPAANQKLSADRANNVMAELAKMGVEPSRMDARGYGDDHPVASNETAEGRARNRRISLRVVEK
jgi:outer membrane protein OmpA-like peptidoglycan-associated protein